MSARIGLLGYYGTRNLGDEAVLEGLLRALQSAAPGCKCIVYATDPTTVGLHPGVEARLLRPRNFAAMLRAVGEIDFLVIGGGGLLHDYSLVGLSRYVLWPLAARLRGRPVMLAAVGVGPVRTRLGAAQIRAAASLARVVTVRDEKSAEWLRRIGVKKKIQVLADPALLLCAPRAQASARPDGPVVMALRKWPPLQQGHSDLARLLARAADGVVRELDADIVLMPFHSPMDDEFCADVHSMMEYGKRVCVAARPASPEAAIERLGQARVVVSMRLHALMLAGGTGVPLVAIAVDEKLASFMKAIGQAECCLSLDALDAESLVRICREAIGRRAEAAERVRTAFGDLQARAGRLTAVLRRFLERGSA